MLHNVNIVLFSRASTNKFPGSSVPTRPLLHLTVLSSPFPAPRQPSTTRGPVEGLGEAGEGVPGPRGREEGWERSGKGSQDQGAGRRAGGGRGRGPRTKGPGGGLGEAGEGVPGPRGREEGWERSGKGSQDQGAKRRAGRGRGRGPRTKGPGGGLVEAGEGVPGPRGREEGWGRGPMDRGFIIHL